ncbi:MAG: TonB-dependent receptor domain-containing protein [Gammaproteobacteria bacterium]
MIIRKLYVNSVILANLLAVFPAAAFAQEKTVTIPEVSLVAAPPILNIKPEDRRLQATHFSHAEISASPVVNLTELLKQEQSIVRLTNNSGDATQTALSIRGFGDNAATNSLILVDGFPLTNPSLLAPNINSIMLSDVERIDILQGSEGVLWGDQAVGGVVNIITRHPEKLFASAIVNVGSYLQQGYRLLVGDRFEHGVFMKVFGVLSQTDHYRKHNQQSGDNLSLEAGIDYARGFISLEAQGYHDDINFPGGLTEQQYHDHPRQATNATNFLNYHTQRFQLLNKHELTADWLLETRLYTQETKGNGYVFAPLHRLDRQSGFSPRLKGVLYQQHLILGYDIQTSDYHLVHRQINSNGDAIQQNLYLLDNFYLRKTLDFTLGARGASQTNHFQTAKSGQTNVLEKVFVTEQGVAFHPATDWSIFLRRAGNFSFPKINEQTLLPGNVSYLKVQQGVSYETGFTHLSDKDKSQINIYQLNLNNELAFDPAQTSIQPFGSFNNLDKTIRRGISFAESYHITSALTLDGQLNYVDARFAAGSFSGKRIPAVPALNANAGVAYQMNDHWHAKYTALYTGDRYASQDMSNVGKQVSGYWLHDVALQYFFKSASISFEALNIFNQRYPAYTSYSAFDKENTYYTNPGRNYQLTFKVDLD